MCGCARKIEVLVLLVTIVRSEIANLPEVVAQPERRTFFKIEAFLPDAGLVHNLELDMLLEILRTHLFSETPEHRFACLIHKGFPILFGTCVEVPNRDKNVKCLLSFWRGSFVGPRRGMDIKRWYIRQGMIVENLIERGFVISAQEYVMMRDLRVLLVYTPIEHDRGTGIKLFIQLPCFLILGK